MQNYFFNLLKSINSPPSSSFFLTIHSLTTLILSQVSNSQFSLDIIVLKFSNLKFSIIYYFKFHQLFSLAITKLLLSNINYSSEVWYQLSSIQVLSTIKFRSINWSLNFDIKNSKLVRHKESRYTRSISFSYLVYTYFIN